MSQGVFICYRTDDTLAVADRLAAELRGVVDGDIFIDHRSLEGGEPWPERLRNEVARASVVLVLIGQRWLTLQGSDGRRRLDDPEDWVRLEVAGALRARHLVVPVLVDGAAPIDKSSLSSVPDIEALADLQAVSLATKRWDADLQTIAALLTKHGFKAVERAPGASRRHILGAVGALALFAVAYFLGPRLLSPPVDPAIIEGIKKTADEARADVKRVVTKFDSVLVQAVYELPQAAPSVRKLAQALTEIHRATRQGRAAMPEGLQISYSQSGDAPPGPPVVSIDLQHLSYDDAFTSLSPKVAELVPLLEFLRQPRLQVGINRTPREPSTLINGLLSVAPPPDLHLFVHPFPVDSQKGLFGKVVLDMRSAKLLVSWNGFEYPPDRWATSRKVFSIEDLGRSQVVLMVSGSGGDPAIEDVAAGLIPRWVNMRFDNHFATLLNFESLPRQLNWQAFSATLPAAQDILDGKASRAVEPAYSWGF